MKKPTIAGKTPLPVQLEAGKTYAWCSCGESANQPFCDGSHKVTTITPLAFTVDEPKEKMLCRCKQTANPPYCDGSHKKL